MASTREPFLHALLLFLARLFLVHVMGVYIVHLINVFRDVPAIMKSTTSCNQPAFAGNQSLKVIACGFPRSGTMSLQSALQCIGFDPCYHGIDLAKSPRDAELWLKATIGKLDDWSLILGGYKAIVDSPAACFYKELMAAYPNAKVILNIRDPEQWYESCLRTIYRLHCSLVMQMFRLPSYRFAEATLFGGKFKGRFGDKEFAIGVYKQHIEEVKREVPKEKLLVYKVQDGWIPLCNFLEVERPRDIPFPQINDSSSFQHMVDKTFMVLYLVLAVYVVLISVVIVVLLKCITSYSH